MNSPDVPLFWSDDYWSFNVKPECENIKFRGDGGELLVAYVSAKNASVPGRATFGGWWTGNGALKTVDQYIQLYSSVFEKFPRSAWQVHLPPAYFFPELFLPQEQALLELGGKFVVDTNSTITLNRIEPPTPDVLFSRGNRKRVRASWTKAEQSDKQKAQN